jgi:Coenzyme PQQ synthesis protein D (PqqD)
MPEEADTARKRYVRRREILDAGLGDGETVLLHPERGHYYGLKGAGQRIWELLDEPTTLNEICTALVAAFDVGEDDCRRQTEEFISELVREQLVDIIDRQP